MAVPLTLEGSPLLHQMFRIRWQAWRSAGITVQARAIDEAAATLGAMPGTAPFAMLGHKAELMLIHFRDSFDDLAQAQLTVSRLALADYLEPSSSYVSVVELGLYQSTLKLHQTMAEKGVAPGSDEWKAAEAEVLANQRRAMAPRLKAEIPPRRYVCFYPMDKRRGESKNWYMVSLAGRQRMMDEHGLIGRSYAGQVKQIISGSIGFDDWEWGVDLFADDPIVFKKLIYEMRFDEASAVYALFGTFYTGLRFDAKDLGDLMNGRVPSYTPPAA